MYVMVAWVVILFWVVGMAAGAISMIFLLDLEDAYIFRPIKHFIAEMKKRFTRIVSSVLVSSK